MKKSISIIMALCVLMLAGCSGTSEPAPTPKPFTEPLFRDSEEVVEPDAPEAPDAEEVIAPEEPAPEPESYEITYANAKTWTNSIGTTWVQTIIEVTNTGAEAIYLSSGAYDLETADGALVASQSMVSVFPAVIESGEKAYYYEETTLDDSPDGELVVVPRVDVDAAKVDTVRYALSDIAISDGEYGGLDVLGRVENTSQESSGMTYIAVVMYDADDTPIGLVFTILTDELAAGDKVGFEASSFSVPDDIKADSVARFEAYAYPLQMQF